MVITKTVTFVLAYILCTFAGPLSRIAIGERVLLELNAVCKSNAQAVVIVEGEIKTFVVILAFR